MLHKPVIVHPFLTSVVVVTAVTAALTAGSTPGTVAAESLAMVTSGPDLSISKSARPSRAFPGAVIAYQIVVSQVGTDESTSTNVVLTERVPQHTRYSAANNPLAWSCPDGSPAGTVCTRALNPISAGSVAVTFAVAVLDPLTTTDGAIVNEVAVSSTGDVNPANDTYRHTLPLDLSRVRAVKTASLVNDANGNGAADPGDVIDYSIAMTNTGTAGAADLFVNDSVVGFSPISIITLLPDSVTTSQGTISFYGNSSGILVDLGQLGAGAQATISFRASVNSGIPAFVKHITNQVQITQTIAPGQSIVVTATNVVTTPLTARPELSVSKTFRYSPAGQGMTVFNIDYANNGSGPATGVVITETLPAHVVFNPAGSTGGWVCAGGACTFALLGTVPGSGSAFSSGTLQFAVTAAKSLPADVDSIINVVRIGDDGTHGPDAIGANNVYTLSAPIGPQAVLSASKEAVIVTDAKSDGKLSPGDVISYVITLRNTSERFASNVVVSDPLDDNLAVVPGSATTTKGTIASSDAVITANIGIVAPGEAIIIRFRASLGVEPPLDVLNIANEAAVSDRYGSNVRTNETLTLVYHEASTPNPVPDAYPFKVRLPLMIRSSQ